MPPILNTLVLQYYKMKQDTAFKDYSWFFIKHIYYNNTPLYFIPMHIVQILLTIVVLS